MVEKKLIEYFLQVNMIVLTVWLLAFGFAVAPLCGWNKYIAEVSSLKDVRAATGTSF